MNILSHDEEEILETLWRKLTEDKIALNLDVLKDNEAFKKLIEKKFIQPDDEQILTKKGLEEGKNCVRRHRLAERLLSDVLSVTGKEVHETGCELEHILHKGLEDTICTLLGHPTKCPHGKPIPRGICCEKNLKEVKKFIMSLDELTKGQKAKISYIQTEDKNLLKKIIAMGILPGLSVKLLHKFPSYVIQIGESQFAVDKDFASQIKVSQADIID